MQEDNTIGVYGLINELCEKFSRNKPLNIKNLRTKCYEILLGKKTPTVEKKFKDLSTSDPYCNLLAWQYVLSNQYQFTKCSKEIGEYHEFISDSYASEAKSDTYQDILKFLLSLRDIPQVNDDPLNLSELPSFGPLPNFANIFRLPPSYHQSLNIQQASFQFEFSKKKRSLSESKTSCSCSSSFKSACDKLKIVESKVPCNVLKEERNIWEIAATEKYCNRKNWENYGYPEPEKEPIFLSELGDLSSLWIDNLYSIHFPRLFKDGIALRPIVKGKRKFIKDLKYLLVGMASESFTYNDFGELILIPDITLEGITEETLEVFSRDFTFSGTCYKSLYEISLPDPHTNQYKCTGYIFAELCNSLKKYLQFYRVAIMSISDNMNLLEFSVKTDHLRKQIATLACICKVGPFRESEKMPHGVALLNYLYQKCNEVIDEKVILVLYSILFPCCQIYFGRFIVQWILEGSVNDPYDEFFIKTNHKFVSTRGRTYWTRSFVIRQDIVPDFLDELQGFILLCGKMMNLLKLCHPFSELCMFLMGKKPQIISCCITRDQLIVLEQSAQTYYLEASEACGPKLSLGFFIRKENEVNDDLLDFMSKKRSATLRRIELERQKLAQEEYEKKLEERSMLKEQYDIALQQKQFNILKDIEREITLIENSIVIEKKREKLIQEEAKDMIEYYEQLFQISDAKRAKIERNMEAMKNAQLDPSPKQLKIIKEETETKTENEEESQIVAPIIEVTNVEDKQEIHSSQSLDQLNANLKETVEITEENNNPIVNENLKQTLENFETAKRNKMRMMNEEMGIETKIHDNDKSIEKRKIEVKTMTQAQKNKLRVMTSEFDVEVRPIVMREKLEKEITVSERNRFRMMSSTVFSGENYVEKKLDNAKTGKDSDKNENFTNNNAEEKENAEKTDNEDKTRNKMKKSISLCLDLKKKPAEMEKNVPMSVDSTPLSEIANSVISTTTSAGKTINTWCFEEKNSFPTTACTDEGEFKFIDQVFPVVGHDMEKPTFSKTVSSNDVQNIKPMCLKMFLRQSLSYSLRVQLKLVSGQLLSFFAKNLDCFTHMKNLRRFFFLQDGEFARSLTDNLFEKLYEVKLPVDLINCRVLSYLVQGALEDAKKCESFSNLSFKINFLPDVLNLGDVEVLSCLSLTYKVDWPLNVLLPSDALGKYNEVFRFLLKISRMHFVLKKIFSNLRMLAKEVGAKEQYLMVSVHYRKIHQFRHVMMHFVQNLQNYVTGQIFQTQWLFEKSLEQVTNLDELFEAHTNYLKNIIIMCLLNQRSAPIRRAFDRIFKVILKFYDYLRSKRWKCEDGTYVHPSFTKLESIFQNFSELVCRLIKDGRTVVKNGDQPHFKHFLDSLNTNNYYSNYFDAKGLKQ